ncbi:protein-disulfide reductase DsbD family protein [Marinomonas sp. RSW2]|uniref:Protein-disulfide reductase DsbD family protein n=1 Tax=Marinomonas maritima TaxID=2940935 RepID=A0ABT5WJI7_9GAMM|nr:protein-disulfide reductase DsbD domain-containing protein [Marinomonas maritima]MDE8604847.1 protein-disulfide reductase DsbD family protein [Marinomonas maritima]
MKRFAHFITWFVFLVCSSQIMANEQGDDSRLISISLITESGNPSAGSTQDLAIIMTPKKGWHGYWINPGDAGFPNNLNWQLPDGVSVGEVQYPAPSQLVVSDIMNYIYHGEYALLAPITIDKGIAAGTSLTIRLGMSYLVCDPSSCLPEQQTIEKTFTVGEGGLDQGLQNQFNQWRQKLPKPMDAKGQFAIDHGVFKLSLPLPSSMAADDAHVYPIINNTIVNNAKQIFRHEGDVLSMQTPSGEALGDLFEGVLVLDKGISLHFSATKTDSAGLSVAMAGTTNAINQSSWMIGITAFFGAILGGLLLNIMPCVFPILSLKILSLSHQGSEKNARMGAVAYTLGAVLVCVLLGGVILGLRALGHQVGWAFQLQSPAVIAALIVLMSAIGFNLAGLFEIGTLTSGSRLQDQKGPMGDFWTGVLAAFIATPCTGPFMATALGAALILPIGVAFVIFAGLGFGMALPFLLVGFVPSLRTRLPKPGGWMVTARRILSLPMFITVLGLVWILMRQSNNDYVLSILMVTMLSTFGLWLTGLWQHSQHKGKWWPTIILTLVPLFVVLNWVSDTPAPSNKNEQTETVAFNQETLNALRAKQDVFLYFTADWCLTCKVNEKTSIDRQEVKDALKQQSVVTMVGDWTNGDSQMTAFLSEHGRSGVPLYLWYKKGVDQPRVLPQILSPSTLIDQAKN